MAAPAAGSNLNTLLIIGLAGLGLVIGGLYWFVKNRTLNERKDQVASRRIEAEKLDAIIKEVESFQRRKDNLQKRIDLINQLKQNQRGPVRIMDHVSQDLPDLVWLDRMSIGGGAITINGRGLNPNAIANFVDNVKNDPYFEEPQLRYINQASVVPLVYNYEMTFHFSYTPKVPGAAGASGATGATGVTGATGATTKK